MNEFQEFEEQVDYLLSCLDLPMIIDRDEGRTDEDIWEMRLAIMFPNLTVEERGGIAVARLARQAVINEATARLSGMSDEQRQRHVETVAQCHITHQRALDALEQYGLRVKLTDFQEQILSRLCGGTLFNPDDPDGGS